MVHQIEDGFQRLPVTGPRGGAAVLRGESNREADASRQIAKLLAQRAWIPVHDLPDISRAHKISVHHNINDNGTYTRHFKRML